MEGEHIELPDAGNGAGRTIIPAMLAIVFPLMITIAGREEDGGLTDRRTIYSPGSSLREIVIVTARAVHCGLSVIS